MIKIRCRQTFEAMEHKGFYLTCPMKIKMFIFRNNKKTSSVEQVEPWSWKHYSTQRYQVRVYWLLLFNLTLGSIVFADSAYPENWTLLYEANLLQRKSGVLKETVLLFQPTTKSSWAHLNSSENKFFSEIFPIFHFIEQHKR